MKASLHSTKGARRASPVRDMRSVTITEVGLRDGLQMESRILTTDEKVEMVELLVAAGVKHIEATSFVSPRAVPQLADASLLVPRIRGLDGAFSALVPNASGARRAIEAGSARIRFFLSASETHNKRNVNRTVAESLSAAEEIISIARDAGVSADVAIATSFGCPFEGDIAPDSVVAIAARCRQLGFDGVVLGDTTGMATPPNVTRLCLALRDELGSFPIGLHFHNTRGLGLVNVMAGLEQGIDRYESSLGGLGGCPFAPGASGNVCTEDLVHLMDQLGIVTGIDLPRLIAAAQRFEQLFGRVLPGQVMKAGPRLAPTAC